MGWPLRDSDAGGGLDPGAEGRGRPVGAVLVVVGGLVVLDRCGLLGSLAGGSWIPDGLLAGTIGLGFGTRSLGLTSAWEAIGADLTSDFFSDRPVSGSALPMAGTPDDVVVSSTLALTFVLSFLILVLDTGSGSLI